MRGVRKRPKASAVAVTIALTAFVASAVILTPVSAAAESKLSGKVVAVSPDGRTFAIEELGPEGKVLRRTVALEGGARLVEVSRRAEGADSIGPGHWPGGFLERPMDPRELQTGDFVTVIVDGAGDRVVGIAKRIEIVRPDGSGEAAASPR